MEDIVLKPPKQGEQILTLKKLESGTANNGSSYITVVTTDDGGNDILFNIFDNNKELLMQLGNALNCYHEEGDSVVLKFSTVESGIRFIAEVIKDGDYWKALSFTSLK